MPTKGRFKDNPGTFGRYQDLEVTGRLIGPQFSRIFASIDRLASADIERGSITADKLSAEVFNAIIATIRDSISIGPGTGFTGYTGTGEGGANEQTRIQFPYSSTVDFGGEYLILYTPTESWGFWFQKSGTDVEPPAWTVDHAIEVDITASASPSLARTQLTAALNAQAADWTATNPGDGYVYATSIAAGVCTDAVSSNTTIIAPFVAVQGSDADEGDRRAYLDQDEFRVQEYRSGSWVTVALLGGTDSEVYAVPKLPPSVVTDADLDMADDDGIGSYEFDTGTVGRLLTLATPANNTGRRALAMKTDDGAGPLWIAQKKSTVTVTIASPAVVSWTGHGFTAGQAIVFRTTGALPTGLTAGTIYYVISAGLAADSFRLALTPGGAAINTSGTQSGAHAAHAVAWEFWYEGNSIELHCDGTTWRRVGGTVECPRQATPGAYDLSAVSDATYTTGAPYAWALSAITPVGIKKALVLMHAAHGPTTGEVAQRAYYAWDADSGAFNVYAAWIRGLRVDRTTKAPTTASLSTIGSNQGWVSVGTSRRLSVGIETAGGGSIYAVVCGWSYE